MIKGVIFDVDGVLLDSLETNLYFFQKLMEDLGYPPPTREQYQAIHFYGMRDVIRELTGLEDEEKIQKIWEYGKTFDDGGPPAKMPAGSEEIIKSLAQTYKLGIVTSRIQKNTFEGPQLLEIKNLFGAVVSYEDTEKHKPDPEPLLLAVKKLNLKPEECVYIGDAETDMQAGKAAGTATIFYTSGMFSKLPQTITGF
jgi:N-acetyl-D-muramate 6-phosphate phosphatase